MHYYIETEKDFEFVIRVPSFAKNLKREIELCPYGCARLRMTEMPVLGK